MAFKSFWSEIGYRIWPFRSEEMCSEIWSPSQMSTQTKAVQIGCWILGEVWNRVRVSRSGLHTPTQIFGEFPPPFWLETPEAVIRNQVKECRTYKPISVLFITVNDSRSERFLWKKLALVLFLLCKQGIGPMSGVTNLLTAERQLTSPP